MAQTLELFDPADPTHRSYRSTVLGERLGVMKTHTTTEYVSIDPLWIEMYVLHQNHRFNAFVIKFEIIFIVVIM